MRQYDEAALRRTETAMPPMGVCKSSFLLKYPCDKAQLNARTAVLRSSGIDQPDPAAEGSCRMPKNGGEEVEITGIDLHPLKGESPLKGKASKLYSSIVGRLQ